MMHPRQRVLAASSANTIFFLAIFATFATAWLSAEDQIAVIAKGKTITLQEHGAAHAYEFDDEDLVLSEIDSAKLLFHDRVKNETYLLMYVSGPSTGGGNGQCGAGEEEYLVWLAMGSTWQKRDQKIELIGSCFFNVQSTSSESYTIKQKKLTAEYDRYTEPGGTRSTLTYDSATPEKAWQIDQKPVPHHPQ
jgi:hypothetical protein